MKATIRKGSCFFYVCLLKLNIDQQQKRSYFCPSIHQFKVLYFQNERLNRSVRISIIRVINIFLSNVFRKFLKQYYKVLMKYYVYN